MTRSFTVVALYHSGKKLRRSGGRYLSSTPASAARKAFSQAVRHYGLAGRVSMEVHILETTRGSHHKTFAYKVSRIPSETEATWIPVHRGEESILLGYTTKIRSLN